MIVFRLADASSGHVSERLEATLARTGVALDAGAVVVIEEGRCRVRSLPIERRD